MRFMRTSYCKGGKWLLGLRAGYRRLCLAVALCFGFRLKAGKGFLAVDRLHPTAFQFVVAAVEHVRVCTSSSKYAANASCKSSSVPRPLCAARSLSFFSASGAKCTSMGFNIGKSLACRKLHDGVRA